MLLTCGRRGTRASAASCARCAAVEFDRRASQLGLAGARRLADRPRVPPRRSARVAYWTTRGARAAREPDGVERDASRRGWRCRSFEYVPHLLAALLILVIGAIAAQFLARSVLIGAVNMLPIGALPAGTYELRIKVAQGARECLAARSLRSPSKSLDHRAAAAGAAFFVLLIHTSTHEAMGELIVKLPTTMSGCPSPSTSPTSSVAWRGNPISIV